MLPTTIQAIFDNYFDYLQVRNLNWTPAAVPEDMLAGKRDEDEELSPWSPVVSRVTRDELVVFGQELGVRLGPQYSEVLQYKHFMELEVGDLSFFAHPSIGWQNKIAAQIFQGHPKELHFDKGMMPFARCGDWGLYCFCIKEPQANGEYAVYRWDHDDPQSFELVAPDLYCALLELSVM